MQISLKNFIEQYDKEGTVILLEGKRKVTESDQEKLIQLGELIAKKTKHMYFRSGNADGADYYFIVGASNIETSRIQIVVPYPKHRQAASKGLYTVSLDEIDLQNEKELIEQSKLNKKTNNLIERYLSGKRDRFSIKAAYIIRDTMKVIGSKNIKPAAFGIFYDDLSDLMSGGTGHTMNICKVNNIPFIDQRTWLNWL